MFYGNENNSITQTLLCVMIKSVAGSYRDVVVMSPVSEINHEKIYKVWKNVVEKITEIGFDIVATMTDGHKSNMKMLKHDICQGKLNTSVPNPYDVEKRIALLFDPTHLLKCVYKNFRGKESFLYPSFDESSGEGNMRVNFAHIKELFHLELGKAVKYGDKLNEKLLNPLALEKT